MPSSQSSSLTLNTRYLEQVRRVRERNKRSFHSDAAHWAQLGRNVDNPATARLIVNYLDQAPHLKQRHGGLYLRAMTVVDLQPAVSPASPPPDDASSPNTGYTSGYTLGHTVSLGYRSLRVVLRGLRQLATLAMTRVCETGQSLLDFQKALSPLLAEHPNATFAEKIQLIRAFQAFQQGKVGRKSLSQLSNRIKARQLIDRLEKLCPESPLI